MQEVDRCEQPLKVSSGIENIGDGIKLQQAAPNSISKNNPYRI